MQLQMCTTFEQRTKNKFVRYLNNGLLRIGLGLFRVGIKVNGEEWSYGGKIVWLEPKLKEALQLKASVPLGETRSSSSEISSIICLLRNGRFRLHNYALLTSNCNHFADIFVQHLGTKKRISRWTLRVCEFAQAFPKLSNSHERNFLAERLHIFETGSGNICGVYRGALKLSKVLTQLMF